MKITFKQVISVCKSHLIELGRNYQIILTNIFLPLVFFITSLLIERYSDMNIAELKLLISSQFFLTSLLFGIITYSLTQPLQDLVELKEEKIDLLLSQTNLKYFSYILGKKISDLIMSNIHVGFVVALFSTLDSISNLPYLQIFILSNLTFFLVNPLATFASKKIKNVKIANNIGTMILLILIFSLTFTKMFSSMLPIDFSMFNKLLTINPLFGYYDTLTNLFLETENFYFGSFYKNILYMIIYAIILLGIENIVTRKRKRGSYGYFTR